MFQRWIFDSYKYQVYFNASTSEITEKLFDAVWPFHPETQPEGVVLEYNELCKKAFGNQYSYNQLAQNGQGTEGQDTDVPNYTSKDGAPIHNPFLKNDENSDLSFLSRNADQLDDDSVKAFNAYDDESNQMIKANQYKKDTNELYGPVWIFVTLIVEFVMLGHLSTVFQAHLKTSGANLGSNNDEFFALLTQRNAD